MVVVLGCVSRWSGVGEVETLAGHRGSLTVSVICLSVCLSLPSMFALRRALVALCRSCAPVDPAPPTWPQPIPKTGFVFFVTVPTLLTRLLSVFFFQRHHSLGFKIGS